MQIIFDKVAQLSSSEDRVFNMITVLPVYVIVRIIFWSRNTYSNFHIARLVLYWLDNSGDFKGEI